MQGYKFSFDVPYWGFYVHDTYQIRPRLTFDLGVREDFRSRWACTRPIGRRERIARRARSIRSEDITSGLPVLPSGPLGNTHKSHPERK